jgi:Na+-transporting NADH:ubiquinone oxidoreductase subunit C
MNDSVLKTIGVAFVICLVSSLVVSFTAVSLRDLQNENATNNQSKKILQAANLYNPDEDIKSQFEKLEQKFVDFSTGKIIDTYNDFDINDYDQIAATRDSNLSTKLSSTEDIAIIKNRENVGKFFIVRNEDNSINKLILPIRGYGLWGTLFGYMAIEGDFNTVAGLEFYDHKETPGLGAEVDNPKWKNLWPGKKIYKDNEVTLAVIKGKTQSDDVNADYKVDGLSGATLTARGVTNMISYWFGDSGYAKLFKELNYES